MCATMAVANKDLIQMYVDMGCTAGPEKKLFLLYDGVERFGYLYDIFICSSDLKIKTLHTGSRKWISHFVPVFWRP